MSGALIEGGGEVNDQGTTAQVIAVETAGTHVGVPTRAANVAYAGQLVVLQMGVPFIAEPALYAAINVADPTLVTWAS